MNKTIAAPATGFSRSGVAVIRISGNLTKSVITNFINSKVNLIENPRKACLGNFVNNQQILDQCLFVFFNNPYSYTGEDLLEIHTHGNPFLVERILQVLFNFGIYPANPGEFTQRAYLNGKIDLVQAESVADIINASNDRALKMAQENLKGKLSNLIDFITEPLKNNLAEIEANIDFADEDIEPDEIAKIYKNILKIKLDLESLIKTFSTSQKIKEGIRIQLLGKPNTGKSSLLNKLLARERAIVSNIPGTTRDILEESVLIEDMSFLFIDSAGIRKSEDFVENIGINRALDYTKNVDLILIVCDQETSINEVEELKTNIDSTPFFIINNKSDISKDYKLSADLNISTFENNDIEKLKLLLLDFSKKYIPQNESAYITNERQLAYFRKALEETETISIQDPMEIIALKIRAVLSHFDEITGRTETEDILGKIFSKFCVGK